MEFNININFDCSERVARLVQEAAAAAMALKSGVVIAAVPTEPSEETKPAKLSTKKAKVIKTVAKKDAPGIKIPQVPAEESAEEVMAEQEGTPTDAQPEMLFSEPTGDLPFDQPQEAAEEVMEPAEGEATNEPPVLSPQNVREAISAIRAKFGDDDPKKPLHKNLTKCIKVIAEEIGGCKPSLLPEDKRWEFVSALDNIRLTDDGQDVTPF